MLNLKKKGQKAKTVLSMPFFKSQGGKAKEEFKCRHQRETFCRQNNNKNLRFKFMPSKNMKSLHCTMDFG